MMPCRDHETRPEHAGWRGLWPSNRVFLTSAAYPLGVLYLRTLIDRLKSFGDNMKLGDTGEAADKDPNSPSEILKLVPEVFLKDHLTQRWAPAS